MSETWARSAALTCSHQRDYVVEAVRELTREDGSKTMTDDANLLARLRQTKVSLFDGSPTSIPVNPDGPEAAARIRELKAAQKVSLEEDRESFAAMVELTAKARMVELTAKAREATARAEAAEAERDALCRERDEADGRLTAIACAIHGKDGLEASELIEVEVQSFVAECARLREQLRISQEVSNEIADALAKANGELATARADEREKVARWHESQIVDGHCGESTPSQRNEFHRRAAAAIRRGE